MNSAQRHQLRELDRALLHLLDERARLLSQTDAADPGRAAAVEDLLRRHAGPFPAEELRKVLSAVDAGCARFAVTP